MPFDLWNWAAGYILTTSANRVTKPNAPRELKSALRQTVSDWANSLPESCSVVPDALFDRVLADDDAEQRPALRTVRESLRHSLVPTSAQWTAAMLENWQTKRTQLGDTAQAFFRLEPSRALQHLETLGAALHRACNADPPTFNNTAAAQLRELVDGQNRGLSSKMSYADTSDTAPVQAALSALSVRELQQRIVEPWLAASGYEHVHDISGSALDGAERLLLAVKEELCESHSRVLLISRVAFTDLSRVAPVVARLLSAAKCSHKDPNTHAAITVQEVLLVTPLQVDVSLFRTAVQSESVDSQIPIRYIDGGSLAVAVIKRIPQVVVSLNDQLRHRVRMIVEHDELAEFAQYGGAPHLSDIFVESNYGVFSELDALLKNSLVYVNPGEADYKFKVLPLSDDELTAIQNCWQGSAPEVRDFWALVESLRGATTILQQQIALLPEFNLPDSDASLICRQLSSFQRTINRLSRLEFLKRRGRLLAEAQFQEATKFLSELRDLRRITSYRHFLQIRGALLVVGNAGAGKTTLLKMLYREWRRDRGSQALMVRAVDIADVREEGLLESFRAQLVPEDISGPFDLSRFIQMCQNGQLVFLLDGLDEAGSRARTLRTSLQRIVQRFPSCPVVVSCRPDVELGEWDQAIRLDLCEFTNEQLELFVRRWFKREPSTAEALVSALNTTASMKALATSPLIAALLCLFFDVNAELPASEVALYQERLDLLLGKWEKGKGITPMPEKVRSHYLFFLRELAWKTHQNERRQFSLVEAIDLAQRYYPSGYSSGVQSFLVDCLSRTLLFAEPDGSLSFGHVTNQEFLAALWLDHFNPEEEVASKLGHPWWSQVLRYYATKQGCIRSLRAQLTPEQRLQHAPQLNELSALTLIPFD